MIAETQEKYEKLQKYFKGLGSVAVAFSSGVDSTLLLKVGHDVLGDNCIALTGRSESFPSRESDESEVFCRKEGIRQVFVEPHELDDAEYRKNPKNRCYICKKTLFSTMLKTTKEEGISYIAEGSNIDDLGDYRPGLQAIAELGIKSPLRECGLTKNEIREISKELDLPTWQKPSYACLASRFAYGEQISKEKLEMVEMAEQLLVEMGFVQMRVRIHGMMARIEVLPEDIEKIAQPQNRERIIKELKSYGFTYVSLDLQGYRTGSMNVF